MFGKSKTNQGSGVRQKIADIIEDHDALAEENARLRAALEVRDMTLAEQLQQAEAERVAEQNKTDLARLHDIEQNLLPALNNAHDDAEQAVRDAQEHLAALKKQRGETLSARVVLSQERGRLVERLRKSGGLCPQSRRTEHNRGAAACGCMAK